MSAYRLRSELTMSSAAACQRELAEYIQGGGVELDGADVICIDAAGVQLLVAAARRAASAQRALVLRKASPILRSTLLMLGLGSRFGLGQETARAS